MMIVGITPAGCALITERYVGDTENVNSTGERSSMIGVQDFITRNGRRVMIECEKCIKFDAYVRDDKYVGVCNESHVVLPDYYIVDKCPYYTERGSDLKDRLSDLTMRLMKIKDEADKAIGLCTMANINTDEEYTDISDADKKVAINRLMCSVRVNLMSAKQDVDMAYHYWRAVIDLVNDLANIW